MAEKKRRAERSDPRRPRYPGVRISLHSDNPWVMVAAVRHELRLAGAQPDEISDFSDQALSTGVDRELVRQVVDEWVGAVGVDAGQAERAPGPG
ncbi:MAG: hypothetical protein GY769_01550 [bacterium]|nr:hypothetical protein [bacterium]